MTAFLVVFAIITLLNLVVLVQEAREAARRPPHRPLTPDEAAFLARIGTIRRAP